LRYILGVNGETFYLGITVSGFFSRLQ
jgi:hypothetical protein